MAKTKMIEILDKIRRNHYTYSTKSTFLDESTKGKYMKNESDVKAAFIEGMKNLAVKMEAYDEELDRRIASLPKPPDFVGVNRALERVKNYTEQEAETIIRRLHL